VNVPVLEQNVLKTGSQSGLFEKFS
jgi:hypothetical protein